jgi:hypothetical protein
MLRTLVASLHRSQPLISLLGVLLLAAACDSPTDPITLRGGEVTLDAAGEIVQLEATVSGTDRLPEWESLHPNIVTVTRAGMATAVSAGTATVKARLAGVETSVIVTVLPPVNVEILSATSQHAGGGQDITLRLRNAGGRGFYRMRFYRASATPGGEPQIVAQDLTDAPVPARIDNVSFGTQVSSSAEWVVIYSREPHSQAYRTTACARLDGAAGCPMP